MTKDNTVSNVGERISSTRWFYRLKCGHSFKSSIGINVLSIVECGACHKLTRINTDQATPEEQERAFQALLRALEQFKEEK